MPPAGDEWGGQPRFAPPGGYQPPPGYQQQGYQQPMGYQPAPYPPQWQAPRPGCIPLRPLGVSDILDGSFRVIRRNPRTTLGLSAIVAVVQTVVLALFQLLLLGQFHDSVRTTSDGTESVDGSNLAGLISGAFSVLVLTSIFGAVLTGMLSLVVTDDVLGHRTSLSRLWVRVRPRLPRLIGLSLLIGVLQFVGLCLFIAPGIWLWGIWAVAVPAFMVEDLGTVEAMGRSRNLVRGTFWRVWGIRALGVAVITAVSSVLSIPFSVVAAVVGGGSFASLAQSGGGSPVAYVLITSVGSILAVTFTAPLRAGIDALLYTDLRMRKEGLDLVLQQQVAATARPR